MALLDVIIIGGGIAGASLGARIAPRRRTLMVEAEEHCGYHSTGRSAAFYLDSYGGPVVAQLTLASGPVLEAPRESFSHGGFLYRRGAVHLSRDEWPQVPAGVDARPLGRPGLEKTIPGLRSHWTKGLFEPGCADIDVAALHAAYLRTFRRAGGEVATAARVVSGRFGAGAWCLELANGRQIAAALVVNAAGAWADAVAACCGVAPLGIAPKRRTMVQLRVGRSGLKTLPLVDDAAGTFYFKGETDNAIWLTPHDEIASDPCDAAPDEVDVATAIARFQDVVDWPVEAVERRWAGLRSFAPDRVPVYGYDPDQPAFFWCAGQGGFGIQTAPAAAELAGALLLGEAPAEWVANIDPAPFLPNRFRGR